MHTHTDIEWFNTIDSTNSEAARRIESIDNLSVIAAEYQTAGRGQGDHKWHSMAAENLTFTLVLKYDYPGCPVSESSLMAPLQLKDCLLITQFTTYAIRMYLKEKGIESRVKWPNDIYVDDPTRPGGVGYKICGILIENRVAGSHAKASIIGIGLNINQTRFPEDLPNPISVSCLTHDKYDLRQEMLLMAKHIEEAARLLNTETGRSELAREFDSVIFHLGEDTSLV